MKTFIFSLAIFIFIQVNFNLAGKNEADVRENKRSGKLLNIFSMVRFKNGPCMGATRNGTCYTTTECSQKGGTNDGTTCAGGFGICCVFTLGCGSMSSENCTYFTMAATTNPTTNPCKMTFCKCSSNICRIRLDFINHVTADPVATTSESSGTCLTDSFTVTSPGGKSPPVICGYNTGQHMFLDASDQCHEMNFNYGTTDTTSSRSFDIKVTQYECGNEKGGPKGCLQYFTGTSGQLASFNYRTDTGATTGAHLINQDYTTCFRREAGNCRVCLAPAGTNTFGLDSPMATVTSLVDTNCKTDYITLPGAVTTAGTSTTAPGSFKICGRFFSSATGAAASATACTLRAPFQLGFVTDGDEPTAINGGTPSAKIGYYLMFDQSSCT